MVMQTGLASGHTALKVLDQSHMVYQAQGKGKGKDPGPSAFPFEFEFPSTINNSNEPLPPTFRAVHPAMEGWIRYTVRVHVIKYGLWPRETCVQALYFPTSKLINRCHQKNLHSSALSSKVLSSTRSSALARDLAHGCQEIRLRVRQVEDFASQTSL
jgi:hypothetical protein